jgi:hypothetical protein
MGLFTNIHEIMAAPIRCSQLDHDDIMQSLLVQPSNYPIKYLEFPCSTRSLRNVDVHPIIDNTASKFMPCHRKNISAVGRATLVKVVIMSPPIIHVTMLGVPPKALQQSTNSSALFLGGSRQGFGGQCKVNWKPCLGQN